MLAGAIYKLISVKSGNTSVTYQYDSEGIRTSKVTGGITHNYVYLGGKLMEETQGNYRLSFVYDDQGRPFSVAYSNSTGIGHYYYILNLQGDVVRLVSLSGAVAASYTYDAWGNVLSSSGTLSGMNPLRYRGYVYDEETKLYYLNSRYYDPANRRMISADDLSVFNASPTSLNNKNLFAYCDNNPVSREDDEGNFWVTAIAVGLATQYVGDVIANVLSGKTGLDIILPSSSLGQYIAAGVTAVIPGTGIISTVVRNTVAEGIRCIENNINGKENNVLESVGRVFLGSALDTGFNYVSDKVVSAISSRAPKNYSSYAGTQYKKNPNLTKDTIYQSMQRTIKINNALCNGVAWIIGGARQALPY